MDKRLLQSMKTASASSRRYYRKGWQRNKLLWKEKIEQIMRQGDLSVMDAGEILVQEKANGNFRKITAIYATIYEVYHQKITQ